MEDRRISAKSIAEQLGILPEQVGSVIHKDLDMLVACFLPRRAKDLSAPRVLSRFSIKLQKLILKTAKFCSKHACHVERVNRALKLVIRKTSLKKCTKKHRCRGLYFTFNISSMERG